MLSFLYVYSDHSILECYNLFSGVELSMRSFFVIIEDTFQKKQLPDFYLIPNGPDAQLKAESSSRC